MSDHVPTTADVRSKYATVLDESQGWRYSERWGDEFDRWLAAEKRKWQAEAWDEGYLAGRVDGYYQTIEEVNPYRESEEA